MPVLQEMHEDNAVAPAVVENVPALQFVQDRDPTDAQVPAPQVMQAENDVAAALPEAVPATQATQTK